MTLMSCRRTAPSRRTAYIQEKAERLKARQADLEAEH
jgi:hypothetical protein